MRVCLDATPLVGPRSGVGQYVAALVAELAARPDLDVSLLPLTLRGRNRLPSVPGARVVRTVAPARPLRAAWVRGSLPPVELLTGRVDVVHGTNFVLPPRRRAAGAVTVHDLAYLRFPETVRPDVLQYRVLVPRALAAGAVVVCPSESVRGEVVAAYGVPAERVVATPLGVHEAWFAAAPLEAAARRRLGVPERYTLFVGTREPRKNLALLLDAHRKARAEAPDLPDLVLVGARGWGEALALDPAVHVLDHVPDETLRSLVAGASAVATPSRYEGFGLPVLEALACGVPVLASDIPAHREVGGAEVRLVPGEVDSWVGALVEGPERVPGSPASRIARARRSTWAACASRTAEAYHLALTA